MSVQEKPKDKNEKQDPEETKSEVKSTNEVKAKHETDVEEWFDTYHPEQRDSNEVSKIKSKEQQKSELKVILEQFTKNLPSWIKKPWMYVKPSHEGHLKSWYESWKMLILSYSKMLLKHVINLYDLQSQHPFTNKESGRTLSLDELEFIVERMVDENLAKWLETSTLARIYYKSDKEWAQHIHEFTIEKGYASEVMTIFELKKLDQEWSKLPENELKIVLDILVKQDQAEWVDSEMESIQFKI